VYDASVILMPSAGYEGLRSEVRAYPDDDITVILPLDFKRVLVLCRMSQTAFE
jgi:hypothetical protein